MPRFAFIGSTGRTATTFISSVLNKVPDVVACHEGYVGSDKERDPAIPLINLENRQAYLKPGTAVETIKDKRNSILLGSVVHAHDAELFIDVAYYNSILAVPLLDEHPAARYVGVVRDCESFVRSATTLHGEDPLPVGWADSEKPLSPREKFIALGRIVPRPDTPEKLRWQQMSAIEKNIWLWRETNRALIDAATRFPQRTLLIRFETIETNNGADFFSLIADHLDIDRAAILQALAACDDSFLNRKPGGYQIGAAQDWSQSERQYLKQAVDEIKTGLGDDAQV